MKSSQKFANARSVFGFGALLMAATANACDVEIDKTSAGGQQYWVEQIAEGLALPSAMAWLPNGDMLIAERMGGLRVVRSGKLDPLPLNGTPVSYRSIYDGLKDITVDPEFESNQSVYLFLSEGNFEEHYAAVYRARLTSAGLKDVQRIFRSKQSVGGSAITITARMTFLSDKTLLVAITEDHAQRRAQQLDSQMGKILRIRRDGSIPDNNPFVGIPGALPEVWTYGHRVPLGLYQDPETGVIWEVESGPRGGDELNILKAGANYGWAKASWGFSYGNRGAEAPLQSAPDIEDPILIWTPSVTPSGFTRYYGTIYPHWRGDYFVGYLTGKALTRLRIRDGQVIVQERMLWELGERIRDVKVGPDELIYVLTDHDNGRLFRLQAGQPRADQCRKVARRTTAFRPETLVDLPLGGGENLVNMSPSEIAMGRQAFLERCAACHSIGEVVPGGAIGPDLSGIYGAFMGHNKDFEYSPSMAGGLIPWEFTALDRFLSNPTGLVPGTKMTASPVTDEQVRRNIIGFLKQQSSPREH